MKKILSVILMLSLWSTLCFANDTYIGNAEGYAHYLKTESIKGSSTVIPGNPIATLTIIYTVVHIPEEHQLNYLRKLMLNDKIGHMTSDFKFVIPYNRMENKPNNSTGKLYLAGIHLYDVNGSSLGSNSTKPSSELPESDRDQPTTAFYEVMEYVRSHQDTIPNI